MRNTSVPRVGREAVDIFCRGFRQCGGDFEVKKYDILPSVGAGSALTISQAKNTGEIGKNTCFLPHFSSPTIHFPLFSMANLFFSRQNFMFSRQNLLFSSKNFTFSTKNLQFSKENLLFSRKKLWTKLFFNDKYTHGSPKTASNENLGRA